MFVRFSGFIDNMETSKKKVLIAVGLQLVLSFCYAITALVSSNACFLVDNATGKCVPGAPHVLFSVSRGESFLTGAAAILFLVHGIWSFTSLRRGTTSITLGALLGSSAIVTVFACATSAVWGSLSSTLSALDCTNTDNLPRADNSTALRCNGYNSAFSALSVIGSLIFLIQAAITGMLYMWQSQFIAFESSGDVYESIAHSSDPSYRHPFEPLQQTDEESSTLSQSIS